MNSQNRYYYLLGTIISKGVTTTVVNSENNEDIADIEDIDIEKEKPSTVSKFLANSAAEKDIENFTVYLLIGSDERSKNSSESRGFVDGERADVIILGLVNEISGAQHLLSIPRDVIISNPC